MSKKSMKQFKQKFEVPKKEVKKKKNEVLAWLLAGFMVLWTIMGVLGTIGFFKSRTIENASASEVVVVDEQSATKRIKDKQKSYNLTTNSFNVPLDFFNNGVFINDLNGGPEFYVYDAQYRFYLNCYGQMRYLVVGDNSYALNTSHRIEVNTFNDIDNSGGFITFYVKDTAGEYVNSYRDSSQFLPYAWSVSYNGYDVGAEGAGVYSLRIYERGYYGAQGEYYYDITIDTDFLAGLYYVLGERFVDIVETYSPQVLFKDVTYWDLITDDGAGTNAFENGYNKGYADGEHDGYFLGSEQGYNVGYADGHADGVEDANVYTFKGLLGAVFDVPVQTFQGLFNFEILGVNLSGFLMAILTIMIILAVIKLII